MEYKMNEMLKNEEKDRKEEIEEWKWNKQSTP